MAHVNYISCDGCGKKITTGNMIYISVLEQSEMKKEDNTVPPDFPFQVPNPVNRKEKQYYFHDKYCMHSGLYKYIKKEGIKIE